MSPTQATSGAQRGSTPIQPLTSLCRCLLGRQQELHLPVLADLGIQHLIVEDHGGLRVEKHAGPWPRPRGAPSPRHRLRPAVLPRPATQDVLRSSGSPMSRSPSSRAWNGSLSLGNTATYPSRIRPNQSRRTRLVVAGGAPPRVS